MVRERQLIIHLNHRVDLTSNRLTVGLDITKFWWITVQKYFGTTNIGGLAALHSKSAMIVIIGG